MLLNRLIQLVQLILFAAALLFQMPSHKTVQLNDGVTVPLQGYGTHQPKGLADQAERIKMALEAGIRHIDCAERYHTEEGVGQALKELGFDKEKRDQIFVTTKV